MIQSTPQMRILVPVDPADFRRGIDGLARLCRVELEADPFSGTHFPRVLGSISPEFPDGPSSIVVVGRYVQELENL